MKIFSIDLFAVQNSLANKEKIYLIDLLVNSVSNPSDDALCHTHTYIYYITNQAFVACISFGNQNGQRSFERMKILSIKWILVATDNMSAVNHTIQFDVKAVDNGVGTVDVLSI